jgi:excisionase family DNA binding protein
MHEMTATAPPYDHLLTADEVALQLRVSASTIRPLIAAGELPAVQVGGHPGRTLRISAAALSAQVRAWEARG